MEGADGASGWYDAVDVVLSDDDQLVEGGEEENRSGVGDGDWNG